LAISDEDRARLAEAGEKYIDEWIQRANSAGLDGQGLVDRYRELVAEYTALRDSEGYPWGEQAN
jgi:TRAP-type transport system periplasmic protein